MIYRRALNLLLRRLRQLIADPTRLVLFLDPLLPDAQKKTVLRATQHYEPFIQKKLTIIARETSSLKLKLMALRSGSLLMTGKYRNLENHFPFNLNSCHGVDPGADPLAAWAWHFALTDASKHSGSVQGEAHNAFRALFQRLRSRQLKRCYVFGTGPSLVAAEKHSFEDGYRIVCNTIVRDRQLMNHLKPDILVAGDALYHFSETEHACAFRKDLKARMSEIDFTFCYPDLFESYVQQEFLEFRERCIPIPGGGPLDLTRDLVEDFRLPSIGNILGLMLLPLACCLAKEVLLLGFDGRRPGDKLFWRNSERHAYTSFIEQMTQEYPAFYNEFIPRNDPFKYVTNVHGDDLDTAMSNAEDAGWMFMMLCSSTSPALAKRPMVALS